MDELILKSFKPRIRQLADWHELILQKLLRC